MSQSKVAHIDALDTDLRSIWPQGKPIRNRLWWYLGAKHAFYLYLDAGSGVLGKGVTRTGVELLERGLQH